MLRDNRRKRDRLLTLLKRGRDDKNGYGHIASFPFGVCPVGGEFRAITGYRDGQIDRR